MSALSPFFFLYIGLISEYFNQVGNIPVDKDLLNMYANGDDINGALAFISLTVIPSYPLAGLSFINLISSSISLLLVSFSINSEMVFGMKYINNPWTPYLLLHSYLSACTTTNCSSV
jgi:hypothetical protein